jgi:hypothetical protein
MRKVLRRGGDSSQIYWSPANGAGHPCHPKLILFHVPQLPPFSLVLNLSHFLLINPTFIKRLLVPSTVLGAVRIQQKGIQIPCHSYL